MGLEKKKSYVEEGEEKNGRCSKRKHPRSPLRFPFSSVNGMQKISYFRDGS